MIMTQTLAHAYATFTSASVHMSAICVKNPNTANINFNTVIHVDVKPLLVATRTVSGEFMTEEYITMTRKKDAIAR